MIVNANALRIPLADGVVQTVVTSPPYYGLRQYDTARWIGGDPNCDHVHRKPGDDAWLIQYKNTCAKCGAVKKDDQLGLEETPQAYIANLVAVFREVWRVLADDGTAWLNLGDSYWRDPKRGNQEKGGHAGLHSGRTAAAGMQHKSFDLPEKNLMMIPARVALALQADGWYLRAEIVWAKPNPMPESVTDRPTRSHEMIYLLTKQARYYYDAEAVREPVAQSSIARVEYGLNTDRPAAGSNGIHTERMGDRFLNMDGRNQRDVWTLATESYSGAHYAVFPTEIPRRAIRAGTSERGHCSKCGKGWVRVVEKTITGRRDYGQVDEYVDLNNGRAGNTNTKTIGWQPACDCDAPTTPAVVLDPFCGSGTTGLVCRELGRRFVGLDLSMEYLRTLALPRAERKQAADAHLSLPLFQEAA